MSTDRLPQLRRDLAYVKEWVTHLEKQTMMVGIDYENEYRQLIHYRQMRDNIAGQINDLIPQPHEQ